MGDAEMRHLRNIVEEQQGAICVLQEKLSLFGVQSQQQKSEVAALRDCLLSKGLLDFEGFQVHLHRHRFAAARAMHRLSLDAHLDMVLGDKAVALVVGHFAGRSAMQALTKVSTVISPPVQDILSSLCPGHMYVCGGFEGNLALNSVERLDPSTGVWEALPPMRAARQYTCAGVVSGMIYVCGGWGGPQPVRSVERFDPHSSQWESVSPMLVARWGASAGVVAGKLFVCGGLDESRQPLSSVECFDPGVGASRNRQKAGSPGSTQGGWDVVLPMSERRGWPAACVLGGWLYVCGGRDEQREPLNSAERLRPCVGAWEHLQPMAEQRAGAAAAAAGRKLYVCGGAFGSQMLNSAERFDPKACIWETLPLMAVRRAYVSAVAVSGVINVFGGSDGTNCLGSAEKFDPDHGLWSFTPTMSEKRSGAAAIAVLG